MNAEPIETILTRYLDHDKTSIVRFRKLVAYRFISENGVAFLLQYIGLMFSTLSCHPSLLWFASGTSTAFIFLRGYSILPGIGLGSFFAYTFSNAGLQLAFISTLIWILQPSLLLWFSRRSISQTLIFYNRKTLAKFIIALICLTFFTTGALWYFTQSKITVSYWPWWFANMLGIFVLGNALVTLDAFFPQIHELRKNPKSWLCFGFCSLFLASLMLTLSNNICLSVILVLAIFILICWFSLQWHWVGYSTAIFLAGLIISLGAYSSAPFFVSSYAVSSTIFLQEMLMMGAIAGLLIVSNEKGVK